MADLAPPSFGPPVTSASSLGELLPVSARTAAERAAELQRVQRLKAEPADYEVELVAAFPADRPASTDRQPGELGAAATDDSHSGRGRRRCAGVLPTSWR